MWNCSWTVRREREEVRPRGPGGGEGHATSGRDLISYAGIRSGSRLLGFDRTMLLVDVYDLDMWARRRGSESQLPELLRRLAAATLEAPRRLRFPSAEGAALHGWDGITEVETGNRWVPSGTAGWEVSTREDQRRKAQHDYDERVETYGDLTPDQTTIVIVNVRRWEAKDTWVGDLRDVPWRDVRVLDGVDIHDWLSEAPAVHVWFSIQSGKRPAEALDLEEWWLAWSNSTVPALPMSLLTADRDQQICAIREWLASGEQLLCLRGETTEEALAIFAASTLSTEDQYRIPVLSRTILVEDIPTWRSLCRSTRPLILVPLFRNHFDVVSAAFGRGHKILLPLGRDDPQQQSVVSIPPLKSKAVADALAGGGLAGADAGAIAARSAGSLRTLRRELGRIRDQERPAWAVPEHGRQLAFLSLVGAWDEANLHDRSALSTVAGREYSALADLLVRWRFAPDPPVTKIGTVWRTRDTELAWRELHQYLTADDLSHLSQVAHTVIGEHDPKYDLPPNERWAAAVHGATRQYSNTLRSALSETMALIGARSEETHLDGPLSAEDWVCRTVAGLFSESDWKVWASLSDDLPLLAEACPAEILEVIRADLSQSEPELGKLLSEAADSTLFGRSPHNGVVWALEVLAWSPDYVASAVLSLARLARLGDSSRVVNQALSSLHGIFRAFFPQTAASVAQRLEVIDLLRRREPSLAWNVLTGAVPAAFSVALPSARPRKRKWVPAGVEEPVLGGGADQEQYITRLLEDVGTDSGRWVQLLELAEALSEALFDRVLGVLRDTDARSLGPHGQYELWMKLGELASQHARFSTATWALSPQLVAQAKDLYDRLAPTDALLRALPLFSVQPWLPDLAELEREEEESELTKARAAAVDEIWRSAGEPGISQLGSEAAAPWTVGLALADAGQHLNIDSFLSRSFESDRRSDREIGRAYVIRRVELEGPDWLRELINSDSVARWPLVQRVNLYLYLPFDGTTWSWVKALGNEEDRLYWTEVPLFGRGGLSPEQVRSVASHLLEYRLALRVIDLLATYRSAETDLNLTALELVVAEAQVGRVEPGSLGYNALSLLSSLQDSDADQNRVANLEWALMPFVGPPMYQPRALFAKLAAEPDFFVELIRRIYRSSGEAAELESSTSESKVVASRAYELLSVWRSLPGTADSLLAWVGEARRLLADSGRSAVGDVHIGRVLASPAPIGQDGAWPHESVRDALEHLEGNEIGRGFVMGALDTQGVTVRGIGEGGRQELELAERYRAFAASERDRWPRTAALLAQIAGNYERRARQLDIESELEVQGLS